jgi:hypothetical protein
MADKLVVVENKYIYRIQWELDDGDDLGAYLCQDKTDGEGEGPTERQDWAASRAVRTSEGVSFDDIGAWWDNQKQAQAALRVAKEALKQDRPMPEWATKALAAGWKPPKGWKA